MMLHILQTHQCQQLPGAGTQIARIVDVFQRKQDFVIHPVHAELIVRVLEQDGHTPGSLGQRVILQRLTLKKNFAAQSSRVGRVKPGQAVGQTAFAAAGRPHQKHSLPGLNGKGELPEHILLLIAEGQVPAAEHRLTHPAWPGPGHSSSADRCGPDCRPSACTARRRR